MSVNSLLQLVRPERGRAAPRSQITNRVNTGVGQLSAAWHVMRASSAFGVQQHKPWLKQRGHDTANCTHHHMLSSDVLKLFQITLDAKL